MSSYEAIRAARALDLKDFSPDAESPAGCIDIEAFQAPESVAEFVLVRVVVFLIVIPRIHKKNVRRV